MTQIYSSKFGSVFNPLDGFSTSRSALVSNESQLTLGGYFTNYRSFAERFVFVNNIYIFGWNVDTATNIYRIL